MNAADSIINPLSGVQTQPSKLQRHDARLSLIIIVCAIIATLFFQADKLLGAIGLTVYYYILGFILSCAFSITTLSLLAFYGVVPTWFTVGASSFLTACMIVGHVLIGWVAAILVWFVPLPAVIVCLCAASVIWIWAKIRGTVFTRNLRQLTTIILSAFIAFYMVGIGSLPEHSEYTIQANATLKGKIYFLSVYWGWLGDPDTLVLYQCNQFALNCIRVHETSNYYRQTKIDLVPEIEKNDLQIAVDGKTIYTYSASQ